ncbi:hypothetical protein PPL_03710 [Heterostelium album PN500]|uniref:Uncharacterized protein n=1 Tax=Heterostelium pallidum (strain ATCC 26659 / Pp 5 / PN500) TaxID=670386 RepID=D3B6G2_HETP5|nr:hypothetical protein PPL_03710 [Heterostelium album PN500]EFA82932.1 hypothetical protein PPL_03710 [Heterostelium album PN500]|eukprot:XP_020435049.1 hypothetical protein PPL_03710 [Heterostelium album PN500]
MNIINRVNKNVIFESFGIRNRSIQYCWFSSNSKLHFKNNPNQQRPILPNQTQLDNEEFYNDSEKFDVPVLEFILLKGSNALDKDPVVEIPEKKHKRSPKEKTRDSSLID